MEWYAINERLYETFTSTKKGKTATENGLMTKIRDENAVLQIFDPKNSSSQNSRFTGLPKLTKIQIATIIRIY